MFNGTVHNNDRTNALEVTRLFCDVILFLIIVVGILSNICVCLCICRNRHLRTYLNVNIVSSCIGNIIGCVLLLPIRIALYTSHSNDSNTWILCRVGTFFRTFCDTLQLFMLTTASFERYQAVAHPFEKSGLKKRSAVLVIVSWTIALSLGGISTFLFIDSALYMPCSFLQEFVVWTDYDTYLIAPLGSILIFVIIVLYTLIVKTLFKHSDVMTKYKKKTSKVTPGVSDIHVKDLPSVDNVLSTHSISVKQTRSKRLSSEILRTGSQEKHKITPISSGDLKVLSVNNLTGNAERLSTSLPDIASTSCDNTVQVVGMDGSVRITKISNEHIAGAVCLMTSNNRRNGRRRVEMRASKKIAILIGTFICCWLPLPVFVISYRLSGQTSLSETLICLLMILGTLGCSFVTVNPVLLAMIHRQLNSALKQLLKIEKIPCFNL